MVDADQDGLFQGIDDFETSWISSSCELNETTGEKINPDCEQQALILLAPSNGLLPGNISMVHQIKENNGLLTLVFTSISLQTFTIWMKIFQLVILTNW